MTELLSATFRASSNEELRQAEEALAQLTTNPEYPGLLCQLIVSPNLPIQIRASAVSQFRVVLDRNTEFLANHGMDTFVKLSGAVPDEFQKVLEIIANSLVTFYVLASEQTSLLSIVLRMIGSETPLPGFMLLDALVNRSIVQWHEVKNEVGQCFLEEVKFLQAHESAIYMHYFATGMVNHIRESMMSVEDLTPFLQIAIDVVGSGKYQSPVFDLCEEFLQIAHTILVIYPDGFNIVPLIEGLFAYAQHGPSFKGYTAMLRVLDDILKSESGFAQVAGNLHQILALLTPAFKISNDDAQNFELDPLNFIESQFPVAFEPDTPREAVKILLQNVLANHPEVALFCLKIACEFLGGEPWEQFQWMNFLSCSSSALDGPPDAIEMLVSHVTRQLSSGNPVLCAAAFQFLANFPKVLAEHAGQFIPMALSALVSAPTPVLEFTSCCACGRLISLSGMDLSQLPGDLVDKAIQAVFQCSQRYTTDVVAQTVTVFISAFPVRFAQFSGNYMKVLVDLFEQYANTEDPDTRRSAYEVTNSITRLCSCIEDPSVFEFLLSAVCGFIEKGYCENFCEDIIPIVGGCVAGAKVLSPGVSSIPGILFKLYQEEGQLEAEQIASIMQGFAIKFGGTLSDGIVEASMQIVQCIVEDGAVTEEDQSACVSFADIIFVVLKRNDCLEQWLTVFEQLEGEFLGDIAASMIHCNPAVCVENPVIYQNWMQNAKPVPFLVAAASLLSTAPDAIRQKEAEVMTRLQFHLKEIEQDQNLTEEESARVREIMAPGSPTFTAMSKWFC